MEQRIEKSGKTTTYYNIKDRDFTQFGQEHEGRTEEGQNVEVIKGKAIRLFGSRKTRNGVEPYDKTFGIGDTAEYDSYNKHYFGEIKSIGAKTVAIGAHGRTYRLSLYRFNWKNIGDMDAKFESNAAWTD